MKKLGTVIAYVLGIAAVLAVAVLPGLLCN